MFMQPLKMEVKQEECAEGHVKLDKGEHDVNKMAGTSSNSGSYTFENEYLCSGESKVKLEDDISECDVRMNADDTKVLSNNVHRQETLPEPATQCEMFAGSFAFAKKEENCCWSKCHDSDCHVVVDQKDMKNVSLTQHPNLVKLGVLSDGTAEQKISVNESRGICTVEDIQLRNDTVKLILPSAVESVHDSNHLTVEADIFKSQISNQMFPHNANNSVLIHGSEGVNQNGFQVFNTTDKNLPKEIYQCPVGYVECKDHDHLKKKMQEYIWNKTFTKKYKKNVQR